MRVLLIIGLLVTNLDLAAQVTPDSLLRRTTAGDRVLTQKDSLDERIQRTKYHLDSLRRLPRTRVDSSQLSHYLQRQQDSVHQQVQYWQREKDSLLSPLDTVHQKLDRLRRRAKSVQDSIDQRVPIKQASETIRSVVSETLPEEVTQSLATSSVRKLLPELSVQKVAPQLPDLPQPVHAIREHVAVWQEKLTAYTGKLSKYQGKVGQYTAPLRQETKVLEQQALHRVPEGELLQQNQAALQDWKARQSFGQEQQRAQLQQRLLASAQDHFAEHIEVLQSAQEKLTDLKKKYTLVQGTTPQKRSSLRGTPLGERMVYGGTLQLQKGPPLAFDLSPQLAYQWSKRIAAGLGIIYRLTLADNYRSIKTDESVYGGRAFAEYEMIRAFLLHGEYERISQVTPAAGQEIATRDWHTSLLAGIGKTYRIAGKWQGSILLLYNFRHQQQRIHPRPWVFRFGFQRSTGN